MSLLCMRHVFFLSFLRLNFLLMRILAPRAGGAPWEENPSL